MPQGLVASLNKNARFYSQGLTRKLAPVPKYNLHGSCKACDLQPARAHQGCSVPPVWIRNLIVAHFCLRRWLGLPAPLAARSYRRSRSCFRRWSRSRFCCRWCIDFRTWSWLGVEEGLVDKTKQTKQTNKPNEDSLSEQNLVGAETVAWVAMVLLRCDFDDAQLPTRLAVSSVVLLPWATVSNVIFLSIENRSPDFETKVTIKERHWSLAKSRLMLLLEIQGPGRFPGERFAVDKAALSSRSSHRMPHGKCLHCLSMLHEVPMLPRKIQDGT